jgi:hypothetical protein
MFISFRISDNIVTYLSFPSCVIHASLIGYLLYISILIYFGEKVFQEKFAKFRTVGILKVRQFAGIVVMEQGVEFYVRLINMLNMLSRKNQCRERSLKHEK